MSPGRAPQTIGDALAAARRDLAGQSETSGLDAQLLLAKASGRDRAWLLAHLETALLPAQIDAFQACLDRCREGEALPYVLGEWEFYGRAFHLTREVLIPRPETELLVEAALGYLRSHPLTRRAADVGTGSGCVAVTLLAETADLSVVATDRSRAALRVAARNAIAHGVESRLLRIETDLLEGLSSPLGLICANLPYVPSADLDQLAVGKREPRLALDGGADGLGPTARLLAGLASWLAPGGQALVEIGAGQAEALLSTLPNADPPFRAAVRPDLAGVDRLIVIDRDASE